MPVGVGYIGVLRTHDPFDFWFTGYSNTYRSQPIPVAWKVFGQMIYSQSLKISLDGALCLKGLRRGVFVISNGAPARTDDCTAVHWETGLTNRLFYIFAPSLPNASTRFSSPSFFVIVSRVHLWSQCQLVSPKTMRLVHSSESTHVS